jgi:hypothetical protein
MFYHQVASPEGRSENERTKKKKEWRYKIIIILLFLREIFQNLIMWNVVYALLCKIRLRVEDETVMC